MGYRYDATYNFSVWKVISTVELLIRFHFSGLKLFLSQSENNVSYSIVDDFS